MLDGKAADVEGQRVLIVEDDYFLSEEMAMMFTAIGANIVGPVGTLKEAAYLIASGKGIDGAVLDINLHGEHVFQVADMLTNQSIPFVFVTGYDPSVLPKRHAKAKFCVKPVDPLEVMQALFSADS